MSQLSARITGCVGLLETFRVGDEVGGRSISV